METVNGWIDHIESNDAIHSPVGFLVSKLREGERAPTSTTDETDWESEAALHNDNALMFQQMLLDTQNTTQKTIWDDVLISLCMSLPKPQFSKLFEGSRQTNITADTITVKLESSGYLGWMDRYDRQLKRCLNNY